MHFEHIQGGAGCGTYMQRRSKFRFAAPSISRNEVKKTKVDIIQKENISETNYWFQLFFIYFSKTACDA